MATPAKDRVRAWRARLLEQGFVPVTVIVPAECAPSLQEAAEVMRHHPHLHVARLVDTKSGKLVGLRRGPKQ